MTTAHSTLADAIGDKLGPVHRGVIWIGDNVVVFGNDNYAAEGVATYVQQFWHWLKWRNWNPSSVALCQDNYTWVITATPTARDRKNGVVHANRCLWSTWKRTENRGRTAPHAGNYQQSTAAVELAAIGGGFTDETLETPLKGRANRVRGNTLVNALMLAKAAEVGAEDVHVLLGGVPFPAKVVVSDPVPTDFGPPGYKPAPVPEWLELAVPTEDIGDPRSEEMCRTATAFVAAGSPLMVRHFGARHETTGKRIMVPVDPQTGYPLRD